MIRQRALERAGWTFWRCFASSWEVERFNMIQSLQSKLDSMGIRATHGISSLIQDVENREWLYEKLDSKVIDNNLEIELLLN